MYFLVDFLKLFLETRQVVKFAKFNNFYALVRVAYFKIVPISKSLLSNGKVQTFFLCISEKQTIIWYYFRRNIKHTVTISPWVYTKSI